MNPGAVILALLLATEPSAGQPVVSPASPAQPLPAQTAAGGERELLEDLELLENLELLELLDVLQDLELLGEKP